MAAQLSRQFCVFISIPNANPFDQRSFSEYSSFPFMEIMQFQGTNSKRSFSPEFSLLQEGFSPKLGEASFLLRDDSCTQLIIRGWYTLSLSAFIDNLVHWLHISGMQRIAYNI